MASLVDIEWIANFTGLNFEDNEERAEFLAEIASDLVLSYCNATWTDLTAPVEARIAVATLTGMGWTADAEAQGSQLRAEQIGDYRVEFQNSPALAMDVERVAHLLRRYRRATGYSLKTSVPLDGPLGLDTSIINPLYVTETE